MTKLLAALAAGIVFGVGLAVSQMTNPAKVLAFLDLAGIWDPSLALVMAGALGTAFLGYRLVLRRRHPVAAADFQLPSARRADVRLVGGAALFGIGWGLVGLCPGPAVASLAYGEVASFGFVAAMLAGMALFRLVEALGAALGTPAADG